MILAKMFVTGTLFLASCTGTAYNVWYMHNSFLLTNCVVP